MPGKIFVNYRRDDSAAHALNIAQYLEREFGGANVFLDIDRMRAGQKFPKVLEERLSVSKVMVVVIGPSWLTVANAAAQRRLDDPEDWVRLEIGRALARGVTVIPVLVGGASLPTKADLPDDLKPLVDHHVATLTTNGFRNEMAGLARDIRAELGESRRWPVVAGGLVAVAAALGLAMYAGLIPMLGLAPGLEPSKVEDVAVEQAKSAKDADRKEEQEKAAAEAKRQAELEAEAAEDKRKAEEQAKAAADEQKRKEAEDIASKAAADEKRRADAAEAQRQAAAAQKKLEAERLATLEKLGAASKQQADAARAAAEGSLKPGCTFRDCAECPEMVVVPAGEFTMGSNDRSSEEPPHKVTIGKPFAVGKFEVTRDQFEAFVKASGFKIAEECRNGSNGNAVSFLKPGFNQTGTHPVVCIGWDDAKAYAEWLSKKTGRPYRLLSEAEWEYSARASTTTEYSFGDTITKQLAQFNDRKTAEVGSFKPNAFGLFDMHGNVWEWVEDNPHQYDEGPQDGSAWRSGDASGHVLRGGSYVYEDPVILGSAFRGGDPGSRDNDVGFRLARTLLP